MQGTVVMLLALSGLGCHHKNFAPAYVETCYSSCYSGVGCYSSCYSGAAYSPADFSCYSGFHGGGYSTRHKHGLFGCKRSTCEACCAPAPAPIYDPCGVGYGGGGLGYGGYGYHPNFGAFDYGVLPVYGTYTPVYEGYGPPGQVVGANPMSPYTPMAPPGTPVPKPGDTATPTTIPDAPSPGNPAPTPVPSAPSNPVPTVPTPPVPPPAATTPATPPPGA
jgi:hypothetical protein